MIKVKTERVGELIEKFGFKTDNHPQLGMLYVHPDGMVFGPQGQFAGLAMPLPLTTAKLISELYTADILMEDTGIVTQAPPQTPQQSKQTASGIIL